MKSLALALALWSGSLKAADFTMFKGSAARLGRSEESLGAPASLAWSINAGGAFYSSPALVSGTAYLGNSDHHVYAYGLAKGTLKWEAELPERIYGSSPQIEGGQAFIACVDGCVYALDTETGAVHSQACVKPSSIRAILPKGPFGLGPSAGAPDILGSPLVHGGMLYFGSDNHFIYAYKLGEAAPRWSYETGDKVHDAAPALDGGLLYMAGMDGRLVALDSETGRLAWKSGDFEKLNTTPMVWQGRLYVGAGDDAMHCLDAATGKEIWKFTTAKGIMSSPSLSADGKRVVFGGSDGQIYCLSTEGSLAWKFDAGGPVLASPLVTGPTVWIGSFGKGFFGIDMADGAPRFSMKASAGIFSSAAASGGKIVFGDRDGMLYCIQASKK